jgi:hypothetical protein
MVSYFPTLGIPLEYLRRGSKQQYYARETRRFNTHDLIYRGSLTYPSCGNPSMTVVRVPLSGKALGKHG